MYPAKTARQGECTAGGQLIRHSSFLTACLMTVSCRDRDLGTPRRPPRLWFPTARGEDAIGLGAARVGRAAAVRAVTRGLRALRALRRPRDRQEARRWKGLSVSLCRLTRSGQAAGRGANPRRHPRVGAQAMTDPLCVNRALPFGVLLSSQDNTLASVIYKRS